MDTEANNTNVPRTAMDTEADETNADTEKDDGAPESGLDNLDRESTGNPGAEMETDLPKVLGKLSGDYNQDGTEVETLQDKEAGTAIRSGKRRMSVENSGNMEPPSHLLRDRSNSDHESGAARHMQDVTGMTEHFSEEPESLPSRLSWSLYWESLLSLSLRLKVSLKFKLSLLLSMSTQTPLNQ
jgi:hypothetical protein